MGHFEKWVTSKIGHFEIHKIEIRVTSKIGHLEIDNFQIDISKYGSVRK